MWFLALLLACGRPPVGVKDADRDGFAADVDCDDRDAAVHPGAAETWYDGIDADCAGDDDYDADADGSALDADCDDTDPLVHPGADDAWYDGIDADCAGNSDWDADVDGFSAPGAPEGDPTDCDDADPAVNPALVLNADLTALGTPGPFVEPRTTWATGEMIRPSDASGIEQHHATVAAGDDGRFAVSWQLGKTYVNPFPLVRLTLDGGPVGIALPVSEIGLNGIKPDIEARPGGYVVGFEETQTAIWLRAIDLDGQPIGDPVAVTGTDQIVEAPDVALNPDGSGYVSFTAVGGDAGVGTHRVQPFDADLLPVGPPIDLDEGGRTVVEVAVRPDGGWVAVATRQLVTEGHFEVYGKVVGGDGCISSFRADQGDSEAPSRPTLAVAADGTFVVTWRAKVAIAEGEGVFGRFFDATGRARSDALQLSGADLDANRPVVAIWGDLVVFAWEGEADGEPLPAPLDVRTWTWSNTAMLPVTARQRLNPIGTEISAERPAVAIAPHLDGTATALVTWEQVGPDTRVAAVPVTLAP